VPSPRDEGTGKNDRRLLLEHADVWLLKLAEEAERDAASKNLVINEHKKGRRFPTLVSSHLVRPENPLRIETGFENYPWGPTTLLEGMPMNSSLASADFSKGRPAAERPNKLRLPRNHTGRVTLTKKAPRENRRGAGITMIT